MKITINMVKGKILGMTAESEDEQDCVDMARLVFPKEVPMPAPPVITFHGGAKERLLLDLCQAAKQWDSLRSDYTLCPGPISEALSLLDKAFPGWFNE